MKILWGLANRTQFRSTLTAIARQYSRDVQKGCECPVTPKVEKIVEEKKCIQCSFTNWKPKPRKCVEMKLERDIKPKARPKCVAGMQYKRPFSACRPETIDPKKKKLCLPTEPPQKKAPTPPAKPFKYPAADWISD